MSNFGSHLVVAFATMQLVLGASCALPTFVRNGTISADWDIGSYPVARFLNPPDKDYVLMFTAPVEKKVQVRIVAIQAIQTEPELGCDATCSTQGIIIRTGDPNMPEKRICCNKDKHFVYTSTTNKMTLIGYNCEKVKTVNTLFAMESRYVDQVWAPPTKIEPPTPRSQCGGILTATKEWNQATYVMRKNGEQENEANPRNCSVMIKAPAGKKVRVRVVAHDFMCGCGGPECEKKGMKIQLRNPTVKDPFICCIKDNMKVFTSTTNLVPISAWNVFGLLYFTIQYRFVDAIDEPESKQLNPKCIDEMGSEMCVSMKNEENFCGNPEFEFRDIKMSCARTCALCGKKAPDCADLQDKAGCLEMKNLGQCETDILFAEYMCAETCGYCANPL